MSEYRDENAEPEEVDENQGKPLEIRVKRLVAHDMDIKQVSKKHMRCRTVINLREEGEDEEIRATQTNKVGADRQQLASNFENLASHY